MCFTSSSKYSTLKEFAVRWCLTLCKGRGGGECHTSSNPQHSHDANDGGVDGQGSVDLNLLQSDAHDGQQHDGQIQLVPPTRQQPHTDVHKTYSSAPNTDLG